MARTRNMAEFWHATDEYIKHRDAYQMAPSYGQIYRAHSAYCDTAVSERGMRESKWMQEMEEIYGNRDKRLDVPFELNRIGEYAIGSEEIEDVVYIWVKVKEISVTAKKVWAKEFKVPDAHVPPPTVRMVEWWARVMRMCPSLKLKEGTKRIKRRLQERGLETPEGVPSKLFAALDVYYVAGAYVTRELQKIMLSMPVNFDDLNACLAYAPWADWDGDGIEEHDSPQARYFNAYSLGIIPMLEAFNPSHAPALIDLFKMKDWFPKTVESEAARELVAMQMLQPTGWPMVGEWPVSEARMVEMGIASDKAKALAETGIPVWDLPSQYLSVDSEHWEDHGEDTYQQEVEDTGDVKRQSRRDVQNDGMGNFWHKA